MAVRIIGCLTVLVLFFAAPVMGQSQLTEKQVYDANRAAVVRIDALGTDRNGKVKISVGTGFLFHRDGYIFTAGHVVGSPDEWQNDVNSGKLNRKITVRQFENNGQEVVRKEVVVLYFDPQLDLALLRVMGTNYPTVQLGDSSSVNPPQEVYAITCGDGNGPVSFSGKLNIGFDTKYSGLFGLDINVKPGGSGGPVFDREGRVVGVVNAGRPDMRGAVFATPINLAVNLVNMTLPAAVVNDVFVNVTRIQKDEKLDIFPNVASRFKEVEQKIKELQLLADQLKQNVRLIPSWSRKPDPADESETMTVLNVAIETDFEGQYLPERIDVRLYPAWKITESRLSVLPNVSIEMTAAESKQKDIFYSGDKEKDVIEGLYKKNQPIPFIIDRDLKVKLKDKYHFSDATLRSLTILGADVEMEWQVGGDKNPKTRFFVLGAP